MPLRLRNLEDFHAKVDAYREAVGCSQDEAEAAVRTILKARYDQLQRLRAEGRDLSRVAVV